MQNKKDLLLYFMLFTTLVIPVITGLYMQNFATWRHESLPLHSFLEGSGAMVAFVLFGIIYTIHQKSLEINHYNYASFGLVGMGVFDSFHAMVLPGDVFVWLHSLAVFFGGILFCLVWLDSTKTTRKNYLFIPLIIFLISLFISVVSILYPQIVPQMLTQDGTFTKVANLLNIIGGSMFIISSFYFIRDYIQNYDFDSLLFAGHTMLFGSAGILFFFSNMWDMQWWLWHFLRFFAYLIALYFMLETFYNFLSSLRDAKEELRLQNQKLDSSVKLLSEYKKAIFEGNIISIADLKGNIVYVNDEFEKISGYTKEELLGKPHSIFRHPQTPKETFKDLWSTIQNKKSWKGLIKNIAKDGRSFCTKITVIPITDTNNNILEYLALREDVTELVESQNELKKNFYTDVLTKLSNRHKLLEDLKSCQNANIAILNIDKFRHINDFYGERFGDKTIVELSNILLDAFYKLDYKVYRNHADEFCVVSYLKEAQQSSDEFIKNIASVLVKIENSVLRVDDEELHIAFSAGISIGIFDLSYADMALKEAKRYKKDFVVYSSDLNSTQEYQNNLSWKRKIKEALSDDRIDIVFQPIMDNSNGVINKYESLVRLIDENSNVISPYYFLNIAKQSKLYPKITKRVIEKLFKYLNKRDRFVSVNISSDDIVDESTKEFIYNMLKESDKTAQIIFELVESEGIESYEEVRIFIDRVKSYGCKVAIDDFGTGYSNFEYLLKLKTDFIKIDGSLIKNIDTNENSYNVVDSIVSFAKKNGIKTIAEFVSSKEILEKVKELKIDYSQGYYISEPKFWRDL